MFSKGFKEVKAVNLMSDLVIFYRKYLKTKNRLVLVFNKTWDFNNFRLIFKKSFNFDFKKHTINIDFFKEFKKLNTFISTSKRSNFLK